MNTFLALHALMLCFIWVPFALAAAIVDRERTAGALLPIRRRANPEALVLAHASP